MHKTLRQTELSRTCCTDKTIAVLKQSPWVSAKISFLMSGCTTQSLAPLNTLSYVLASCVQSQCVLPKQKAFEIVWLSAIATSPETQRQPTALWSSLLHCRDLATDFAEVRMQRPLLSWFSNVSHCTCVKTTARHWAFLVMSWMRLPISVSIFYVGWCKIHYNSVTWTR